MEPSQYVVLIQQVDHTQSGRPTAFLLDNRVYSFKEAVRRQQMYMTHIFNNRYLGTGTFLDLGTVGSPDVIIYGAFLEGAEGREVLERATIQLVTIAGK